MGLTRAISAILLTFTWACAIGSQIEAQEVPLPQLTPGSARKPAAEPSKVAEPAPPQTVALTVAKGAPLQVALDQEIRVKKVGQPVHARIVEPVYAFDHIVVPVGSEVIGEITKIESVAEAKRVFAVRVVVLTPLRKDEV